MATRSISLLNAHFTPDASGDVFPAPMESQLALGTAALGTTPGFVMQAPTGADIGFYGQIEVPDDYVGTPEIVIGGIIDGTPANAIAFGCQAQPGVALSEAIDQAYEAEDLVNNSTWTGYADEDYFETSITMTPAAAYAPGDIIQFFVYRDDSVDTQTIDFILKKLRFRYANA